MRKALFWIHLAAGVFSGTVLLFMSVTGILLAYEPQIVAFAEKNVRSVTFPPQNEEKSQPDKIPLSGLLQRGAEMGGHQKVTAITLSASPSDVTSLTFGRNGETVFLHPYTGEVLGKSSSVRKGLHQIEEWHRWLGSRKIGKSITGLGCLLFLFLILSGLYLWIPRTWSLKALRTIVLPRFSLRDRARNWNWHHSIGLWFAPLFLLTATTGVILSYEWIQSLAFGIKERPSQPAAKEKGYTIGQWVDSIPVIATARKAGWKSLTVRIPKSSQEAVQVTLVHQGPFAFQERSQLRFDAISGEETGWESYGDQGLRKRLRNWIKPLHTGQAFGILGQTVMGITACMVCLMIYTGFSLAWSRLIRSRRRASDFGGEMG